MSSTHATRTLAVLTALSLGGVTAWAQGPPPNFEGKVKTGYFALHVKFGKSGKPVRITKIEWDGYPCGSDNFTAGSTRSIRVTDGRFSSTQRVGFVDKPLNFTIRGSFSADATKAHGTIRVQTCVGTLKWSVRRTHTQ